jgi:hypothetical protein
MHGPPSIATLSPATASSALTLIGTLDRADHRAHGPGSNGVAPSYRLGAE